MKLKCQLCASVDFCISLKYNHVYCNIKFIKFNKYNTIHNHFKLLSLYVGLKIIEVYFYN